MEAESHKDISIDLEEIESATLTSDDLNKIGSFFVYDEKGLRLQMSELWSEFKTIFVFVRSFLCFTSKEYVEDLALIPKENFVEHQVRLVVIGCAHWKHIRSNFDLKNFRKLTQFPYFIFSDVDYDIYNALKFLKNRDYGDFSESCHVKSTNFQGMLSSAFRAVTSSPMFDYQGNFNQQGGCLIVGPGAHFHYLHRDKHARDHCPINFILGKVDMPTIEFGNRGSKVSVI